MNAFLAKVYGFKFLDAFILIYPLYAVMFVDAGLSASQIGLTLAVWSVTAFALEIPAGVLADRWPRRAILSAAQLARAAGFAAWLMWPTFWGFLAGFLLWGVKSAFTSGTFEALVYDALKAEGREGDYTRIAGRAEAMQFVGILAASAATAALIGFGYRPVLMASIAGCGLAALVPLTFPRVARARAAGDRSYFSHLKLGLRQAAGDRVVLDLIVFIALALTFGGALEEFWAIFAIKAGLTRAGVALFIAAIAAAQAAASALAHRTAGANRRWFYGAFAFNGGLLILAAALFRPASVILLVAFSGAFKVIDVVFEARLQHAIPSESRATIASVKAFAVELAVTALLLSFGPLAQATSYRGAFLIFGGLIVALGAAYLARRVPSPLAGEGGGEADG